MQHQDHIIGPIFQGYANRNLLRFEQISGIKFNFQPYGDFTRFASVKIVKLPRSGQKQILCRTTNQMTNYKGCLWEWVKQREV